MNTAIDIEKKSSAITLSDMEIFVFPELMFSLVLANIMSEQIWEWKKNPWFKNIDKKSPYKRILRLKQFIMDKFVFNLDLETWGLTTQETEIERFKNFISPEELKKSNALFGYQGDTYYFDIGIRKHFGLDGYNDKTIPYWKTETVEAMSAFEHKKEYNSGAGECVSLSTLYAAALFIIAKIPLTDIYLMATPLHSQNFVDVKDGLLTNNRRIVTKNMWANGTELSAKARRAIENEKITIIAHESGYIHHLYETATIDKSAYNTFSEKITYFTKTKLTPDILGNFIRHEKQLHSSFQFKWNRQGHNYYIKAETIFAYEQNCPYLFTSNNRHLLINEIDADSVHSCLLPERIIINDIEDILKTNNIDLECPKSIQTLKSAFETSSINSEKAIQALTNFCLVKPQLPKKYKKIFKNTHTSLGLSPEMDRHTIISKLKQLRETNTTVDLAFYAYRDFSSNSITPFIYAAINRNPVSREATKNKSIDSIIKIISEFTDKSIYCENYRLAQPDEVWNFHRGDGLEKAILLANILLTSFKPKEISIKIKNTLVIVQARNKTTTFPTTKKIKEQTINLDRINKE